MLFSLSVQYLLSQMGRLKKYKTKKAKEEAKRIRAKQYYWDNKEKQDERAKQRYRNNKNIPG